MLWPLFVLVAVQAIYSTFKLNLELLLGRPNLALGLSVLTTFSVLIMLWRWHGRLCKRIQTITGLFLRCPRDVWITGCIVVGSILGLIWISLFPGPLRSDYATYFSLAESLAEKGSYGISNSGYAYWPPGYPMFLLGHFVVFGVHRWVPAMANFLLFAGTIIVAYNLAERVLNESGARLATFLLVLWPANFTSIGLASKERLLVFLLSLVIWLFLVASERSPDKQKPIPYLLIGITLGFATLTQPSFLFFPVVLLFHEFRDKREGRTPLKFPLILAGMLLTITPWTFRNYVLLQTWVPIATNGGDVFYRANNSLATGGYTPSGTERLDDLNELERNRAGFRLGLEWIKSHPTGFVRLALRKQTLFLGDDAHGVFESLKRALAISDYRYILMKAVSNLYWLTIWIMILIAATSRLGKAPQKSETIFLATFFYFYAVHSIFESGGRHHEPLTVCLALLAGFVVVEGEHVIRAGQSFCLSEKMRATA